MSQGWPEDDLVYSFRKGVELVEDRVADATAEVADVEPDATQKILLRHVDRFRARRKSHLEDIALLTQDPGEIRTLQGFDRHQRHVPAENLRSLVIAAVMLGGGLWEMRRLVALGAVAFKYPKPKTVGLKIAGAIFLLAAVFQTHAWATHRPYRLRSGDFIVAAKINELGT